MRSSDTGNSRRCSSFGGIRDHEVLVPSQDMIIDAYIKKAQQGLIKRPEGTIYLESACITTLIKRDGEKDETIEANYPNRGTSQLPGLGRRVLAYLDHDKVFLPINHYRFTLVPWCYKQ